MPKNLEIKARIKSSEEILTIAYAIGATFIGELLQNDTYFHTKNGRLKLRESMNAQSELIYYDRVENISHRLSNFEVFLVGDALSLKKLLDRSLGVRAVVQKRRHLFMYHSTRIHVDDVHSLGYFLEFEVPITDSEDAAKREINGLVEKFKIKNEDCVLNSYIDIILDEEKSSRMAGETLTTNNSKSIEFK